MIHSSTGTNFLTIFSGVTSARSAYRRLDSIKDAGKNIGEREPGGMRRALGLDIYKIHYIHV